MAMLSVVAGTTKGRVIAIYKGLAMTVRLGLMYVDYLPTVII